MSRPGLTVSLFLPGERGYLREFAINPFIASSCNEPLRKRGNQDSKCLHRRPAAIAWPAYARWSSAFIHDRPQLNFIKLPSCRAAIFSGRAFRHSLRSPVFQNLWKIPLPRSTQEPLSNSIRWFGSMCSGRWFSQVMPFLCEPLPRAAGYRIELFNGICRPGGELALPLGARVSRSIGNFDSTANPLRWQEPSVDEEVSIVRLQ